jgi:hypothetical protein
MLAFRVQSALLFVGIDVSGCVYSEVLYTRGPV